MVEAGVGLLQAGLEGVLAHHKGHHGQQQVGAAHHQHQRPLATRLLALKVQPVEGEEELVGEDEHQDHPHQREVDLQGRLGGEQGDVELAQGVGDQGVAGEVQQPLVLGVVPG